MATFEHVCRIYVPYLAWVGLSSRRYHYPQATDWYDLANYSMNPYAFSFAPRYARGGERKPIQDLDGRGTGARSAISAQLEKLKGERLQIRPDDETRSLRVTRLINYNEFIFVELGVGRAGVVGALHQKTGTRIPYSADEHNENLVRGIFVFPRDGHEAYWLSERAGLTSAFSHLSGVLTASLRERFPELTVKLDLVAEWSVLNNWASKVLVEELRFDAPRLGGSTQAIDVNGVHADVRLTVKPRGSLALKKVLKDDGPDREVVFGFLAGAPLIEGSGVTTDGIIGAGWNAQVAFRMPNGRQRSFGMSVEDSAPTLVYPVGSQGAGKLAERPADREFAEACNDFLTDIDGRMPGLMSVAEAILDNIK